MSVGQAVLKRQKTLNNSAKEKARTCRAFPFNLVLVVTVPAPPGG